ncbi:MAG: hypothetical protein JNM80_02595 [Phycisphaerae bacterium]|nr:hypothetical protein [Phycisphaerae bacterium]
MHASSFLGILGAACIAQASASAQFSITWSSIDGGGTTTAATGGTFSIVGTIGQPDAGTASGGAFACVGGFWAGVVVSCYANCDGSTIAPVLNVNDFTCFLNLFAAGSPAANCDASTNPPVLNINDFTCFLNRFAIGCP